MILAQLPAEMIKQMVRADLDPLAEVVKVRVSIHIEGALHLLEFNKKKEAANVTA